jgi:hypothetical protein
MPVPVLNQLGVRRETRLDLDLVAFTRWRRRESNPRRRTAFEESQEDPDLARADAGKSASRPRHKRRDASGEKELPFIHPGQLSVFDLLGDG